MAFVYLPTIINLEIYEEKARKDNQTQKVAVRGCR